MATVYFPKVCDTNIQTGYNLPNVNLTISGVPTTSNNEYITLNTTAGTFEIRASKQHYNDYSIGGCKVVAEYECDVCGGPVTGAAGTPCPVCGEPLVTEGKQYTYQVAINDKTDKQGGKIVLTRANNICMSEKDFNDAVISGTGNSAKLIDDSQYTPGRLLVKKTYIYDPYTYVSNYASNKINTGITRSDSQAFKFKDCFVPNAIPDAEIKYIRIVSGKTHNIEGMPDTTITGTIKTNTTFSSSIADTDMFPSGVTFGVPREHPDFTLVDFSSKVSAYLSPDGRVGTISFYSTTPGVKTQQVIVTQGAAEETFSWDAPNSIPASQTGITVTANATPSATIRLYQGGSQVGNEWTFTGNGQTHTFSVGPNLNYNDITYTLSGATPLGSTGGTRTVTQLAKPQAVSLSNISNVNATATTIPFTVTFDSPSNVIVKLMLGAEEKASQTITTSPTNSSFAISPNTGLNNINYTIVATTPNGTSTSTGVTQYGASEYLSINAPDNVAATANSISYTASTNGTLYRIGLFSGTTGQEIVGTTSTAGTFSIAENMTLNNIQYVISGRTTNNVTASKQVRQNAADAQTVTLSMNNKNLNAGDTLLYYNANASAPTTVYLYSGSPLAVAASAQIAAGNHSNLTFGIQANNTYNSRGFELSAITQNGSGTDKITGITQAAADMSVSISANSARIGSGDTTVNYSITANPSANVYLIGGGTTQGPQAKAGTTSGSFTVSPNTASTDVTYVLSAVTSDNHGATAQTIQSAAHYYLNIVTGKTQTFAPEYMGFVYFYVDTNIGETPSYSIYDPDGMFSQSAMQSLPPTGTVYGFRIEITNMWAGQSNRVATITFSGRGLQDVATISQELPYININPATTVFTSGGGSTIFTVSANTSWSASTNNPTMITGITPTTGNTGVIDVTYWVAQNQSPSPRSGQITVANTGSNVSVSFTVSQSGAAVQDAFTFNDGSRSKNLLDVDATGTTFFDNVISVYGGSSNAPFSVQSNEVPNADVEINGNQLTVTVGESETMDHTNRRSITLKQTGSNSTITLNVSQEGSEVDYNEVTIQGQQEFPDGLTVSSYLTSDAGDEFTSNYIGTELTSVIAVPNKDNEGGYISFNMDTTISVEGDSRQLSAGERTHIDSYINTITVYSVSN